MVVRPGTEGDRRYDGGDCEGQFGEHVENGGRLLDVVLECFRDVRVACKKVIEF